MAADSIPKIGARRDGKHFLILDDGSGVVRIAFRRAGPEDEIEDRDDREDDDDRDDFDDLDDFDLEDDPDPEGDDALLGSNP